jgi:hypothetical protein
MASSCISNPLNGLSDDDFPNNGEALVYDQNLLEPIAVIDFSLKFPQEATSSDAF